MAIVCILVLLKIRTINFAFCRSATARAEVLFWLTKNKNSIITMRYPTVVIVVTIKAREATGEATGEAKGRAKDKNKNRVIFFLLYNPFVNFLIMTICVYLFIPLNDKVLLSLESPPSLQLRITIPSSSPSSLTFYTFFVSHFELSFFSYFLSLFLSYFLSF